MSCELAIDHHFRAQQRQRLQCARGGLGKRPGFLRRVAVLHDHAGGAESGGRAQDRADIPRVRELVEHHERSLPEGRSALEPVLERLALEEGREVLAVPGSVFSRLSAGPNGLLRAGAAPVLTADDVLAALGLPPPEQARGGDEPPLLAMIPPGEAASVDSLAAASGQPIAQVLQELLALELAGRVVRQADGSYRRSHASPPA